MKQLIEHPKDFLSEQFFNREGSSKALPLLVECFLERRNDLLNERAVHLKKIQYSLTSDFIQTGIRKSPWKCARMNSMFVNLPRACVENTLDLEDGITPHWSMRLGHLIEESKSQICWVKPRSLNIEEKNTQVHYRVLPALFFDLYFSFIKMKNENKKFGIILSKIESAAEARFYSDLIFWLEDCFKMRRGSVEVSLEFDTMLGCREAEEIVFELKDRATSLSFDIFGYGFSFLKILGSFPENVFFADDLETLKVWTKPLLTALSNIAEKRNLDFLSELHSLHPVIQDQLRAPVIEKTPHHDSVKNMIANCLNYLKETLSGRMIFDHSQFEFFRSLLWQWNRFNVINVREIFDQHADIESVEKKLLQTFILKESLIEDSTPSLMKYLRVGS